MDFLKKLAQNLHDGVFVAKKSTLVGIAVLVGTVVAQTMEATPNKVVSMIGGVLGMVLIAYKGAAGVSE